ncbi:hypothetical protein BDV28DRAFT_149399 [Aspergillus coremiiformis]|uniref:Uncharacterized protein n=1 Tax=Aspergillus coremiiformis TaxID=138285 RepID=A0A5N6Z3N0_9EURO|nr:hypothetical protein BDV28DRAFT_149399 [Aspergillus coremiiformis]
MRCSTSPKTQRSWESVLRVILFALSFPFCLARIDPDTTIPLGNSTTDATGSEPKDHALSRLNPRATPSREWTRRSGEFDSTLLIRRTDGVDPVLAMYFNDFNDKIGNFGNAVGWPFTQRQQPFAERTNIKFRCDCSRLRVKLLQTAWLHLRDIVDRIGPDFQRLRELHEREPTGDWPAADRKKMQLFQDLYGQQASGPVDARECISIIDRLDSKSKRVRKNIQQALDSNNYKVNFWCTDLNWGLRARKTPKTTGGVCVRPSPRRGLLYNYNQAEIMTWFSRIENWLNFRAERGSYCPGPDRPSVGRWIIPDTVDVGEDHITFCHYDFFTLFRYHITDWWQLERGQFSLDSAVEQTPEGRLLYLLSLSHNINGGDPLVEEKVQLEPDYAGAKADNLRSCQTLSAQKAKNNAGSFALLSLFLYVDKTQGPTRRENLD